MVPVLGVEKTEKLIALVNRLETVGGVGELMGLVTG
jgi:hypothetical protein